MARRKAEVFDPLHGNDPIPVTRKASSRTRPATAPAPPPAPAPSFTKVDAVGAVAPDGTVYVTCPFCDANRRATPKPGKHVSPSIAWRIFERMADHIAKAHIGDRK